MKTYVIPLSDSQATLEIVGGKGMSLAKMIGAGFPVPDGFHITTDAYRAFVDANNLQTKIIAALKDVDASLPAILEAVSATIRELFADAPIPADIAAAIRAAYLPPVPRHPSPVAVRSSATAEDLPEASFAGQQETYLNIRGETDLLDAVKKCWASLWTARAIAYRIKNDIDQKAVALAVVVQEMVGAEAAGILFTANPLNGHRDQVLINASWGLGEAVVGGQVTPDTLMLDKTSGRILARETGEKLVQTVLVKNGTQLQPVQKEFQNAPVLNDEQAARLVQLGVQIEKLYGIPMDIEWALADGKYAILQARPITAFPALEATIPIDWKLPKGAYIAMRNNIVELMADPLTPLFSTLGLESVNTAMNELLLQFLGRPGIVPREMIITINDYAYYNGSVKFISAMGLVLDVVGIMKRMFSGAIERWTETGRPKYFATVEHWRRKDWQQLPSAEIIEAVRQLTQAAIEAYGALVSGVIPAAWISEGLFTLAYKFLKRREDPIASTYLLGFDSLPIQAEKRLYDFAAWARTHPELADHIGKTTAQSLIAELRDEQAPDGVDVLLWREWQTNFQDHLKAYGHMIYNLDFGSPLPVDDPAPLLEALKLFLSGQGIDPHQRQREAAMKREEATETMTSRLKGLRLKIFQRNLERAQRYAPLREDGLAEVGLSYPLLRQMLFEIGYRFVEASVIEKAEDIFWLRQIEVETTIDRLARGIAVDCLREHVPQRKAVWQAAKRTEPPMMLPQMKVFGFDLTQLKKGRKRARGNTLKGVAASPGRVTAPACVINGPEDFVSMKIGDVLVAPLTTPAWTSLFTLASAIITDVGGPLSHGSIVAREYGIPAVLGTGSATRQIQSGQIVTVDGSSGIVTLESTNGRD